MNAAPRSSRVVMNRIDESAIASITWRFSSPGSPKTYSTPSFSRQSTSRRATVGAGSISLQATPATGRYARPVEFREVVSRRRMVRRFEQRPVPGDTLDRIIDVGRRAPSAGFSQGLELLVLDTPETIAAFWETTRDPEFGWEVETVDARTDGPDPAAPGPSAVPGPLRATGQDRVRHGRRVELAGPVLGDRRRDGIDADPPRRGRGGLGRMVLRHHLGRAGAPRPLRRADASEADRIIGLGYRAGDEEPSGSWMKHRRRSLEEQVHRNGW